MIGDIHVAQRPFYQHFGIEFPDGTICEYSAGVVRLVPFGDFARESATRVLPSAATIAERAESVRRAASRIDERAYNLLTNNCEHFVNWCTAGVAISKQVIVGLLALLVAAIAWLAGKA